MHLLMLLVEPISVQETASPHHHWPGWLFACFLLGILLHVYIRATINTKGNPWPALKKYITTYGNSMAIRAIFEGAGFLTWLHHPDLVDKYMPMELTLPREPIVCWALGLASDLLLDKAVYKYGAKIPLLKYFIPVVPGNGNGGMAQPEVPAVPAAPEVPKP